jgi:hypothetical protein
MPFKLTALELARWRLASVWFTACGFLFLILVGQSLGGVYEGGVQSAWGWALPNFVPTLALMISVFAADALKPYDEGGGQQVRSPFFKLSMSLSIFYLFVLILTLLAQPIVSTLRNGEATKMSPLQMLEMSNLWLAPLQGLVVGSLGILFFLKQTEKKINSEVNG